MQPPTQPPPTIKRKLLLLAPLLLALLLLTDSTAIQSNGDIADRLQNRRHHPAFVTALSRHPPSLRVFRMAGETAWGLLCGALALWVWEGAGRGEEEENGTSGKMAGEGPSSVFYRDETGEEKKASGTEMWEAHPSGNGNGRRSNGRSDNDAPRIRITPEAVGRLLFAPPPDSISGNAAWRVYQRHRPLRRLRRRRKRSRSGNVDEEGEMSEQESGSGCIGEVEIPDTTIDSDGEDASSPPEVLQPPLPPSSSAVLGAALDVLTVTCACLVLFTVSSAEGGRYIDQTHTAGAYGDENAGNDGSDGTAGPWMPFVAKMASPLFPLALFLLALVWVAFPWRRRKAAWTIVSLTIGAPFYEVTFRDGFVGDVLTSTVRPLQDLAFTVFFLPLGLRAWWARELYALDAAAVPLERSWILHTVVLPACTLSPLWWRFLQNLRQCYDAKRRWPYLGNALKYMLAAEVAVFGLFDPTLKRSPLWLACFLLATLYQIWWDVFMDWGLLERDPCYGYHLAASGTDDSSSRWLQWWPYTLRSQRLYRRTWIYYAIFGVNFCLRFVGMMTLIPPHHLSRTTGLIVNTYNDPDFQLFAGSLVASAEIFRRTIWALLRLEWEVIKTTPARGGISEVDLLRAEDGGDFDSALDEDEEMKPMAIASSVEGGNISRRWPFVAKRPLSVASLSDMSSLNDIQVLSELCVWATIFSGIAIIAAAHREVL
ncbi:hypothetical protein ACHAXT_007682 [Thalassiosira profunda]